MRGNVMGGVVAACDCANFRCSNVDFARQTRYHYQYCSIEVDAMRKYILLPNEGFESDALKIAPTPAGGATLAFFSSGAAEPASWPAIEVLAEISEAGPKVVRMDPLDARRMRQQNRELRVVPERKYRRATLPMPTVHRLAASRSAATVFEKVRISVIDDATGLGIQNVDVVVYANRDRKTGVRRRTTASGVATISLPDRGRVDEVLLFPASSYWGLRRSDVSLAEENVFRLRRIETFTGKSLLARCFRPSKPTDGAGVRVGVIDSGIDAGHPQLEGRVKHAECSIVDEDPEIAVPFAGGHGTHVAGIIAARDFGLAPAADIYDFRVFSVDRPSSSNDAIMKAIYSAAEARCDLINLSLSGGTLDEALNLEISRAMEKGAVCLVAAGNRSRSACDYPANFKRSLAVTAYGHRHSMPPDAVQSYDPKRRYSRADDQLFVGGFCNTGPEVDFTGPGIAVVSAWPDGLLRVESGTSMAAPAVTGLAARLLSRPENRAILQADRDFRRAMAIIGLLRNACRDLGFPVLQQGIGAPQDTEA